MKTRRELLKGLLGGAVAPCVPLAAPAPVVAWDLGDSVSVTQHLMLARCLQTGKWRLVRYMVTGGKQIDVMEEVGEPEGKKTKSTKTTKTE